jgi:hypothetical protein
LSQEIGQKPLPSGDAPNRGIILSGQARFRDKLQAKTFESSTTLAIDRCEQTLSPAWRLPDA